MNERRIKLYDTLIDALESAAEGFSEIEDMAFPIEYKMDEVQGLMVEAYDARQALTRNDSMRNECDTFIQKIVMGLDAARIWADELKSQCDDYREEAENDYTEEDANDE